MDLVPCLQRVECHMNIFFLLKKISGQRVTFFCVTYHDRTQWLKITAVNSAHDSVDQQIGLGSGGQPLLVSPGLTHASVVSCWGEVCSASGGWLVISWGDRGRKVGGCSWGSHHPADQPWLVQMAAQASKRKTGNTEDF